MSNGDKMSTILSPIGEIVSMSLQKAFKDKYREKRGDSKEYRHIKLMFDRDIPEHAEFEKKLIALNPALIGTKSTKITKSSQFTVGARTTYEVQVVTANNTPLTGDDIPRFNGGTDTGTARMRVTAYTKGENASIPLNGVQLVTLNLTPKTGTSGVSFEALDESLQAAQSRG